MSKSFDFSNNIRDVNELFDTLIAEQPLLTRILLGDMSFADTIFQPGEVSNTKYEWINDQLSPVASAIAGFDTDGDGTGVNVASTSGMVAGQLLRVESSTGASRTEILKIDSVDSSTELTVSRDYGGSTGVTLVAGDVLKVTSQPLLQNTTAGDGIKHEGSAQFNYTEIIDEVAEVSRTSHQTSSYDKYTQIEGQMKAAMIRFIRKVENAIIHGLKVAPATGVPGSMGGIRQLIDGNIDSTGGALSQTLINNVFEEIAADGGMSNNYLIMGHPTQTRKISALNTGGTNPVVFKQDEIGQRLGNFVTNYVSDLPLLGGAMSANIFSNWQMVQDEVVILDMNRIKIKTMQGAVAMNAAQNGQDGLKERILTEITLEVMNGGQAHGKITGLSL
jgi:hypothetical protein